MIQGILLAAGEGKRFQASLKNKRQDKLMATLPSTQASVLALSAQALQQVLPNSIAVTQPQQLLRQQCLQRLGIEVHVCEPAAYGMGYALSFAITQTPRASGWLIMLADMPWIKPALISKLIQHLKRADDIVLPTYQGQHGHPVLFGAHWREQLSSLKGDRGAKRLIQANADHVVCLEWPDDSILRDIDVVADLNREC